MNGKEILSITCIYIYTSNYIFRFIYYHYRRCRHQVLLSIQASGSDDATKVRFIILPRLHLPAAGLDFASKLGARGLVWLRYQLPAATESAIKRISLDSWLNVSRWPAVPLILSFGKKQLIWRCKSTH